MGKDPGLLRIGYTHKPENIFREGNQKHYKIKRKSSERVKKLYVKRMVETSFSFNFYFTKARSNRSSFSISRVRTWRGEGSRRRWCHWRVHRNIHIHIYISIRQIVLLVPIPISIDTESAERTVPSLPLPNPKEGAYLLGIQRRKTTQFHPV